MRRPRSNSPLQALTTLNEPLFFECAEGLAQRTLEHGGDSDQERLTYAFRCCVARTPTVEESETLLTFLNGQRERFRSGSLDPQLMLSHIPADAAPHRTNADPPELAAWTALSRVLLNLDETITKE